MIAIEAKFPRRNLNRFPNKKPVRVLTVISMNNEKQSGNNFKALLLYLNKQYELGLVQQLIIVVSGALHLHYIELDKRLTKEQVVELANDMDNDWITNNREVLNCLQFDWEIIKWDKLLKNNEKFQTFFEKIKDDANGSDEVLRKKMLEHSGKYHAEKLYKKLKNKIPGLKLSDCLEAAIKYVIEECAAFVALDGLANHMVYPGKMNPCFKHIYKRECADNEEHIEYREYKLESAGSSPSNTVENNLLIKTDFFSTESKRKIRFDVLDKTKRFLKNANPYEIGVFIKGFDELVIKSKNGGPVCTQRRLSW